MTEAICAAGPDLAQFADSHPQRFRRLTTRELRALPAPRQEWCWDDLIPGEGPGLFVARPGHGKTFIALQLAVAVATGMPLFGRGTSGPRTVAFVELEQGDSSMGRRLKAIVARYGSAWGVQQEALLEKNLQFIFPHLLDPIHSMGLGLLDWRFAHLQMDIESALHEGAARPGLVVVDTLNAVGEGDENKPEAWRNLWAVAHLLATRHCCPLMFIHHYKKTGGGRYAPALRDRLSTDWVRGSSSLEGSARWILQMGWLTPAEAATVGLPTGHAERMYAILGATKSNEGPPSPLLFLGQAPDGCWDLHPEGDTILARLLKDPGSRRNESPRIRRRDEVLLAFVEGAENGRIPDKRHLQSSLFPGAQAPRQALDKEIRALRTTGMITEELLPTERGRQEARRLRGNRGETVGSIEAEESSNGVVNEG